MAIVIDDERPHACWACDYRCGLNIIARTEEEGVDDDCPIIGEIPDKHGRLIDADKLYDALAGENLPKKVFGAIVNAPTVLEAST